MKQDHGFVYVIQMEGHPLYKIGRSSDVPRRMSEIGIQLPFPYKLCFAHRVPNSHYTEADLHKDFAWARRNGEWFELPPSALPVIQYALLIVQAQNLIDLVVRTGAYHQTYYSVEGLAQFGRLFSALSRRLRRRIEQEHQYVLAYEREVEDADTLSADIVI